MKKVFLLIMLMAFSFKIASSQNLENSLRDTIQRKFWVPELVLNGIPQHHYFAVQLYVYSGIIKGYQLNSGNEEIFGESFERVFKSINKQEYKGKLQNGKITVPIFIFRVEKGIDNMAPDTQKIESLFEFKDSGRHKEAPLFLLNPIVITYSPTHLIN